MIKICQKINEICISTVRLNDTICKGLKTFLCGKELLTGIIIITEKTGLPEICHSRINHHKNCQKFVLIKKKPGIHLI